MKPSCHHRTNRRQPISMRWIIWDAPYTMYYVAGGNHHEVIEKEPDGNLLVLTSSLEGHIEDKIQEIDRQTGEVVNELIMEDIFGGKYEDRVDWTI